MKNYEFINEKVVSINANEGDGVIVFTHGWKLTTKHELDCCESHYWSLSDLSIDDFDGLEFDLDDDNFFERIEGYGIALKPTNGFPIRIPAYGSNNGYYSQNLSLVLYNYDKVIEEYDITECQESSDEC
jgi:hypothetical protein